MLAKQVSLTVIERCVTENNVCSDVSNTGQVTPPHVTDRRWRMGVFTHPVIAGREESSSKESQT